MTGRQWLATVVALIFALGIAWLAVRAAVVRALPPQMPLVERIAGTDGSTGLDRAMAQMTTHSERPSDAQFGAVLTAANRVPLDDRPFLIMAFRALLDKHDDAAMRLLEEARRRDARQPYTRLVLLDRYLRAGRVHDAVTEMTVLSRILPGAGAGLIPALAKLAIDPTTAVAARQALADDPHQLNDVLTAMVAAGASPSAVLAFAGPRAPRGIEANGWMTALIVRLVKDGDYSLARRLWAAAYRLAPASVPAAGLYDTALSGAPGGAPFNWVLTGDETGSSEVRQGALSVEYYGRQSGVLASQLVVLPPGPYRLRFAIEGSVGGDNGGLNWTVSCAETPAKPIVTGPLIAATSNRQTMALDFVVPASGCRAQTVALAGVSGEFSTQTSMRFTQVALDRPRAGATP